MTTKSDDTTWDVTSWDYPEPDDDGIPHGTRNGYQYHQCRGAKCRAAHNEKCLAQRAAKRARGQRPSAKV